VNDLQQRAAIERSVRFRAWMLGVHRYTGLATALFLLVAGLTGSALAFYHELDALLNPELLRVAPPSRASRPLDPLELHRRLEAQLPAGARAISAPLEQEPHRAARFRVEAADERGDDEYFVDPYRGRLLGSRREGDLGQGRKNVLPFIYRLHDSLALGEVGTVIMGSVALLWTVDCFVGAYLTFPPRTRAQRERSWFARWWPAWLLRTSHLFALVFSWHRASGLWVWSLLLVFAWSAVGFTLSEQVYSPVMNAAFGKDAALDALLADRVAPGSAPALSWHDARAAGRRLMASEAQERGFTVQREYRMSHHAEEGVYRYQVHSSLDVSDRYPDTTLWLDADSGELVAFYAPSGEHAGRTTSAVLFAMHLAALDGGGMPFRVLVCVLGAVVALLSITGVWIWWKKLRQSAARARR
jgi:uncharacterized iron-regulated membrane protein